MNRRASIIVSAASVFCAAAGLVATARSGVWRSGVAAIAPPEVCLATGAAPPQPNAGMILIPAGTFKMGSEDFRLEEAPLRDASVESFWIDAHDVTNAQFAKFVAETGYVTVAERRGSVAPPEDAPHMDSDGARQSSAVPGSWVFVPPAGVKNLSDLGQWWTFVAGADWRHPEGPASGIGARQNHPVVHVAFEDAEAYARWAGRTLPTEEQWEFAARGGREGEAFLWNAAADDTDEHPRANHWRGVFPTLSLGTRGYKGTSPVGCFPANGYGLYDMAGNVWQWTRTAWTPDHMSTASPGSATYTIKGGSFLCATNFCLRYRPAARQPGDGTAGAAHIGFRTVLAQTPPQ